MTNPPDIDARITAVADLIHRVQVAEDQGAWLERYYAADEVAGVLSSEPAWMPDFATRVAPLVLGACRDLMIRAAAFRFLQFASITPQVLSEVVASTQLDDDTAFWLADTLALRARHVLAAGGAADALSIAHLSVKVASRRPARPAILASASAIALHPIFGAAL
jgi:hypothetical protein